MRMVDAELILQRVNRSRPGHCSWQILAAMYKGSDISGAAMERPRLKAHFRGIVSADDVFVAGEDRHFLVRGPGAAAVLPYLDGTHTVTDIAIALRATLGP